MDIHLDAIRRYGALLGEVQKLSEDEIARAEADRESLGDEYTPKGEHQFDRAALLLRFLHEVAHLPLSEARIAVIVMIERQGAYHVTGLTPSDVATRVARDTRNILIAEATAALFLAAARGTGCEIVWQQVLETYLSGQIVEDEDAAPECSAGKTLH